MLCELAGDPGVAPQVECVIASSASTSDAFGRLLATAEYAKPIWSHDPVRGWLNRKQYHDGRGTDYSYTAAGRLATRAWSRKTGGGTPVTTDTSNQFAYRFSTKPLEEGTGLYYYGYRFFDPTTGRWLSRDPIVDTGCLIHVGDHFTVFRTEAVVFVYSQFVVKPD